jgi:hypothetical protein
VLELYTAFDCEPERVDYEEREAAFARFRKSPDQFMPVERWL